MADDRMSSPTKRLSSGPGSGICGLDHSRDLCAVGDEASVGNLTTIESLDGRDLLFGIARTPKELVPLPVVHATGPNAGQAHGEKGEEDRADK